MRVAIDLTALLPARTGVDTYLLGLSRALARIDRETRYTLFVNAEDRDVLSLPDNFRVVAAARRARALRLAFQQAVLPLATIAGNFDVVHSPSFIMPMWRAGARHVLTLHDFTSFTRPECHTWLRRSRAYREAVSASVRRADRVITPSTHVRNNLFRLFPSVDADRVLVVPYGVDDRFCASPHRALPAGLPASYVLYVGTLEPRKNLLLLLRAYERLVERGADEHLVLVGKPGWYGAEFKHALDAPALTGRVHVLGYVDDHVLPAVYAAARAFVYPSLEEGFGFPPLEAMASGVPTVASDSSSLAEHLRDAALLVRPTDERAIAEALQRVLRDEPLRSRLRKAGHARAAQFSWDDAARATRACYAELAAAPARRSRRRRALASR